MTHRKPPSDHRDVSDYFPMTCDRCGFKAKDPHQMLHHQHDETSFSRPEPDHPETTVDVPDGVHDCRENPTRSRLQESYEAKNSENE